MGSSVVHWEISARDGKRAQEFYGKLFDWKIDANNPMAYGLVDTGGAGINGGIGQVQDGQPPDVTFYVQVSDLQEYLDKAEDLGGKTLVPPTEIPNTVTFALFQDLDGNTVGLVKG
jgi:predicted enzyme related to lactoylglutathione lyase